MKDYSNYGNQIDMMDWSAKKLFEVQLQGDEGETVDIDSNKDVRVIIQEHTNPLNELKEDRKIFIPNTISVHRGSIVQWNNGNEIWMIINNISSIDDNGVFYECKMYPCNTILNWICLIDNITIHTIPAIQSNMSLYSIGTDSNKYLSTEDGKRMITIPMNDDTKEIYVGQRFIIGLNVFIITEIYDGNMGVYELKLQQTEKLPTDDFENNIASNGVQTQTTQNTLLKTTQTTTPKGFW